MTTFKEENTYWNGKGKEQYVCESLTYREFDRVLPANYELSINLGLWELLQKLYVNVYRHNGNGIKSIIEEGKANWLKPKLEDFNSVDFTKDYSIIKEQLRDKEVLEALHDEFYSKQGKKLLEDLNKIIMEECI